MRVVCGINDIHYHIDLISIRLDAVFFVIIQFMIRYPKYLLSVAAVRLHPLEDPVMYIKEQKTVFICGSEENTITRVFHTRCAGIAAVMTFRITAQIIRLSCRVVQIHYVVSEPKPATT